MCSGVCPYVVDLRSDTVTRPTPAMRDAMRDAVVADDVYGEDPTVNQLQELSARMLGKEKGLFVPSGTMANLIAVMTHCDRRGCEIITGEQSHIFRFEQGGVSQLAGVLCTIIPNEIDGTFNLKKFESLIRVDPDIHEPHTTLCCVENTHNMCGGKILPLEWLQELASICKKYKLLLHMDGARLFNAAVASNVDVQKIVADCDSVSICLSKSLAAPVGSVLVGSEAFIAKARRMRKVLGGGMRQAGVIAAAGIVSLTQMVDRLSEDHIRTQRIAKAINDFNNPLFQVHLNEVQTNILMVYIMRPDQLTGRQLVDRLSKVIEPDEPNVVVKLCTRDAHWVRITLHYEITDADVELVIKKLEYVFSEYEKKLIIF